MFCSTYESYFQLNPPSPPPTSPAFIRRHQTITLLACVRDMLQWPETQHLLQRLSGDVKSTCPWPSLWDDLCHALYVHGVCPLLRSPTHAILLFGSKPPAQTASPVWTVSLSLAASVLFQWSRMTVVAGGAKDADSLSPSSFRAVLLDPSLAQSVVQHLVSDLTFNSPESAAAKPSPAAARSIFDLPAVRRVLALITANLPAIVHSVGAGIDALAPLWVYLLFHSCCQFVR